MPAAIDLLDSISRLRDQLRRVPYVLPEPAPSVEILTYHPGGSLLTVRPYCHSEHYWQVYFDTNRVITELYTRAVVA